MKETIKAILFLIVLAIPATVGGMVVIGGGDGTWQHERNVLINGLTIDVEKSLTHTTERMKWVPDLESSRATKPGDPRKGTVIKEVRVIAGVRHEYTLEITELEPDKLVVLHLRGTEDEVTLRYDINTGGSVTVAIDTAVQLPASFATRS